MKYCRYCGNKLNDDDRFCTVCGKSCDGGVETVEAKVNESPYVECKTCGARVDRGEYSCPVCGAPLSNNTKATYNNYRPMSNEKNKMATAGMILGIIGVVLISWLVSGLGLIFGIVGLTQINGGRGDNKGQAMAGIILGAIGLVFAIIFIIFIQPVLEQILQEMLEQLENSGEYGLKMMFGLFR